ncbi:hypothetical protein [Tepidiforma thermophila]|nr:hypothetical protein [Tepidiforma thermophila]
MPTTSSNSNGSPAPDQPERLPLDLWLRCLEAEYLKTFIPQGGAAIKVAVVPDESRGTVRTALRERLEHSGFTVFDLTEEAAGVHSIEQFWFALARLVDWERLAGRVRARVATEAGYPPGPNGEACTLGELARSYDIEAHEVSRQFQQTLSRLVFRDYSLALDFRKAMVRLVHDPFQNPESIDGSCAVIRQWFDGTLPSISQVRSATIFRRIDRTNARQILLSFLRLFTREFGPAAILVDLTRYYRETNERGYPRFTRRQLFDLYETLREFLDAASEMERTVLFFLTSREFIESERISYHQYRALQARIENEVRSLSYPNPCAAMVQLR